MTDGTLGSLMQPVARGSIALLWDDSPATVMLSCLMTAISGVWLRTCTLSAVRRHTYDCIYNALTIASLLYGILYNGGHATLAHMVLALPPPLAATARADQALQ